MNPKVQFPTQFPGATDGTSRRPRSQPPHPWMGPWFLPLSAFWYAVLATRHALYDWGVLRSERSPIPTLVVGNMELGGTGKTPHIMDLAQRLEARLGEGCVAILSRGYGRLSPASFAWVGDAKGWAEVGDEPWMMQAKAPSIPVAVCADRLAGLRRMHHERPELKVVLLDDGLQHRALRPHTSLALASRPVPRLGMGCVVPAGPWRDIPKRLLQVDAVVATQQGASLGPPKRTLGATKVALEPLKRMHGTQPEVGPALLVTGIANPERLVQSLGDHEVAGVAHYPDHHAFAERDVIAWRQWGETQGIRHLLVCSKDAVRLEPLLNLLTGWTCWEAPMSLRWDNEARLNAWLDSWVRSLP